MFNFYFRRTEYPSSALKWTMSFQTPHLKCETKPNVTNGYWTFHSSPQMEEKSNRIIHTFKPRHDGKTWPTSNQYAINLYSSLSFCSLSLLLAVADSLILLFSHCLFSSIFTFFFDFIAVIFTFPLFPFG